MLLRKERKILHTWQKDDYNLGDVQGLNLGNPKEVVLNLRLSIQR